MSERRHDAFEDEDNEEQESGDSDSSSDLPLVSGVTEVEQDGEPMFAKLYDILTNRRLDNAQALITRSLTSLQEAMNAEPNPMMKARLAMSIQMLREGPSA